jgi:hypothetical protein
VAALTRDARKLEGEVEYTLRGDVNNYFILLVTKQGKEEQSFQGPFEPVKGRLEMTPFLRRVVDELGIVMGRSRFMLLKAGEKITAHTDNVNFRKKRDGPRPGERVDKDTPSPEQTFDNGYWGRRFRIHVPIVTHPDVRFGIGSEGRSIHMEAGAVYLFDNGNRHWVTNNSTVDRVHLVIDTVGSRRLFELLGGARVFGADGTWGEPPPPGFLARPVKPDSAADSQIRLVYEDWIEPAAFDFMPVEMLERFLQRTLVPRVRDEEDAQWLKRRLERFYAAYGATCTAARARPASLLPCDRIVRSLLADAVQRLSCGAAGEKLLADSSLPVADLLEVILREAYYACDLRSGELPAEPTAQDKEPALVLPIAGHPFRVPKCWRDSAKPY